MSMPTTSTSAAQPRVATIVWKEITYDDGMTFEIKCLDNVPVLKIQGKMTFEGTFDENYNLHGDNCKYTFKLDATTMRVHKGNFEHGKLKQGVAYIIDNDGHICSPIYEGIFDNKLNFINGTCTTQTKQILKGEFKNGSLKKGIITLKNGVTIEGEFDLKPDSARVVQATVTYPNGKTINVDRSNGIFDNNGKFHKEHWAYNQCIMM